MRAAYGWFLSVGVVLCLWVVACDAGVETTAPGNDSSSGGAAAEGSGGLGFTTGSGTSLGLVLEPADATIVVTNGVATPVQFSATVDGEKVFPGKWWTDFAQIASVDAQGLVSATTVTGGPLTVYAEHDDMEGSATVTVIYNQETDNIGLDDNVKDLLKNATTADAETQWMYPYNETVFPQGLLGPELMWNNGGADDYYYVHFSNPYLDYGVFTTAAPPSRFQLALDDWVTVSETGNGPMDVKVTRLAAGAAEATVVADHDWTIAYGRLNGTVYYWANNLGRIVRIQPGEEAPDDFLADAGVTGCTACHSVSADGHTLIIGGDDTGTSTYDLVNDTTTLSIGNVGKGVRNWAMPAISPNGQFLVENNAPLPGPPGGSDGLWNANTGEKIAGSGLDGVLLDMPAFGPAGTHLAYVGHDNPHDLWKYKFDMGLTTATDPVKLVDAGDDPNLNCIAFPSVSPTVKSGEVQETTWVVYHRGQYPQSLDTRYGPGHLYMTNADEPGTEYRLENANGDNYDLPAGDRDRGYNYEPTFAPANAGGYFWVVFTSRRTYGNRLTGAANQVKQLWMVAIDQFPEPGEDPSHPAIWLPGQDPSTLNMRGYWALDPCIQQGQMCMEDEDCCNGEPCEDGLCGGPSECADNGELCNGDADCCDPDAQCVGGICQKIIQ